MPQAKHEAVVPDVLARDAIALSKKFVLPLAHGRGEGGIVEVPREWLARLKLPDVPLIVDEIQTGLSRTGQFLASAGYVGTRGNHLDRALNVARKVRTGTFSINGGMWYGGDSPFGGYQKTGIDREMSNPSFKEYLELKTVAMPEPEP